MNNTLRRIYDEGSYLDELTDEALRILGASGRGIINEALASHDSYIKFIIDLEEFLFFAEPLLVKRFINWINELNHSKKIICKSYTHYLDAILWAFKEEKVITRQTQHQYVISCNFFIKFVENDISIVDTKDAKYLMMCALVIGNKPNLYCRSLQKLISTYTTENHYHVLNQSFDNLFRYLFLRQTIPDFLFEHIYDCSYTEFNIITKLLEGKSLRKIVPKTYKLSKTENAILHQNKIRLQNIEDHFLARYIIAAKLLKVYPQEWMVLSWLLKSSKIFKEQFFTFQEDIEYWISVFRFYVKNAKYLGNRYIKEHYLDFFEAKRYYSNPPLIYSLKGRTFNSIERAVDEWSFEFNFSPALLKYTWQPLFENSWSTISENNSYIIEEITTGKRLREESIKLNHCVYAYSERCKNGYTHIFSLSKIRNKIKKPLITIEVTDNTIVQVAGKVNRLIRKNELSIVQQWSKHYGLLIDQGIINSVL